MTSSVKRFSLVLAFVLFMLAGPSCASQDCDLKKLDIERSADGEKLTGASPQIEISWESDDPDGASVLFDAPFHVKDLSAGKSCIIEQGIWDKNEVFLGAGDTVLVVKDFADPNDGIVFYDTRSCEVISRIEPPILEAKRVDNRFVFEGACEDPHEDAAEPRWCIPARVFKLDCGCTPVYLEDESLALTKEIFGVEFSQESEIELPYSPEARIQN